MNKGIYLRKEKTPIPRQNTVSLLAFVLFIVLIILIFFYANFSKANSTIEYGAMYNTATENEKIDLNINFENKRESLELKFKSKLSKEQIKDELVSMNIELDTQMNFYPEENWFWYLGTNYNRDMKAGLLDRTDISLGSGYKDKINSLSYSTQAGISTRSIFYAGKETVNSLFLLISEEIKIPLQEAFELKNYSKLSLDLHKINDKEYEFDCETALIAHLMEPLYLVVGLDYKYINNLDKQYPNDQKTWGIKLGVSF